MSKVFKQSSFSRSQANERKMGAYYTDVMHCRRIGQLFQWPEDEVCVLEPSIGDATAVEEILLQCPSPTLFGVELNHETAENLEKSGKVDHLLEADFLKGVKITHKAFSFCFSNPPYGMDQDEKERLERKFVEKTFSYMANGGIYVLVVPYYVLTDEAFLKSYFHRFKPIATYRFDEAVYKQFKQIVVIGSRRESIGSFVSDREEYMQSIDSLEKLPFLPGMEEEIDEPISVSASDSNNIEHFTTLVFDFKKAGTFLKQSSLYEKIAEARISPYTVTEIGNPPVELKKDQLYLCAISGGGQGKCGCEEDGDLHLQRGEAKVIVEKNVERDEKGNHVMKEVTRTRTVLNIIENDGRITCLE